jgi:hypothetical protein
MSDRSAFCRSLPLTLSQIAPLAGCPILAELLQVAARHVEADAVAEDVLIRFLGVDAAAALADGHHHFGFIVEVRRLRRIVHVAAARNQRELGLDEEKRGLAAIAAHFLLVLDVVAPDAEDASHRVEVL